MNASYYHKFFTNTGGSSYLRHLRIANFILLTEAMPFSWLGQWYSPDWRMSLLQSAFLKLRRYQDPPVLCIEEFMILGINATQGWSETKSLVLNADKATAMNTSFSNSIKHHSHVDTNSVAIASTPHTKFLDVTIDNTLNFNYIGDMKLNCNSRLVLMSQLKSLCRDFGGLKVFQLTTIVLL